MIASKKKKKTTKQLHSVKEGLASFKAETESRFSLINSSCDCIGLVQNQLPGKDYGKAAMSLGTDLRQTLLPAIQDQPAENQRIFQQDEVPFYTAKLIIKRLRDQSTEILDLWLGCPSESESVVGSPNGDGETDVH